MGYAYVSNLRTVMINNMDQFEDTDEGFNLGIGYSGWDDALSYARQYNKNYFGSVFLISGDAEDPFAFDRGMWRWGILVRMHVKWDGQDTKRSDQNVMDLSTDFVNIMMDTANKRAVVDTGWVKVVSSYYISDPVHVNDVPYLSMEFLISVKEQI